jgi:hypothetical protein
MEKSALERIVDPPVEKHHNLTTISAIWPGPKRNGAVPNIKDPQYAGFSARSSLPYANDDPLFGQNNRADLVGNIHQESSLNKAFFSQQNVDKLQKDIYDQVLLMSGGKFKIDRQNDLDLKVIMRSYYLMFGENNPAALQENMEALNRRVVGYSAGKIYSEVDFHMFYLQDIAEFAPPVAGPINASLYGTRMGELKSFL